MPSPTYNIITIDSVTKQMEVTINPGETITLVCSGSNGFFPTSKGWYFGGTPAGSPDVEITPMNMFSYYIMTLVATGGQAYRNMDANKQPASFTADHFKMKNTGSAPVKVVVTQHGL